MDWIQCIFELAAFFQPPTLSDFSLFQYMLHAWFLRIIRSCLRKNLTSMETAPVSYVIFMTESARPAPLRATIEWEWTSRIVHSQENPPEGIIYIITDTISRSSMRKSSLCPEQKVREVTEVTVLPWPGTKLWRLPRCGDFGRVLQVHQSATCRPVLARHQVLWWRMRPVPWSPRHMSRRQDLAAVGFGCLGKSKPKVMCDLYDLYDDVVSETSGSLQGISGHSLWVSISLQRCMIVCSGPLLAQPTSDQQGVWMEIYRLQCVLDTILLNSFQARKLKRGNPWAAVGLQNAVNCPLYVGLQAQDYRWHKPWGVLIFFPSVLSRCWNRWEVNSLW